MNEPFPPSRHWTTQASELASEGDVNLSPLRRVWEDANVHGATQFFEGLFDVRLAPGESFQYTFTRAGEYFFNDSFSPRPTGKIEVY